MSKDTVCGVLLHGEAITILGEAIKPYLRDGRFGPYIYCRSASQNGAFLDMEFAAADSGGTIRNDMLISVPLQYVKMIVSGSHDLPIGFMSA